MDYCMVEKLYGVGFEEFIGNLFFLVLVKFEYEIKFLEVFYYKIF